MYFCQFQKKAFGFRESNLRQRFICPPSANPVNFDMTLRVEFSSSFYSAPNNLIRANEFSTLDAKSVVAPYNIAEGIFSTNIGSIYAAYHVGTDDSLSSSRDRTV